MKRYEMRCLLGMLATVVLAGIGGCATISAQSDYDHEADFTRLRSFAWMTEPPVVVSNTDMPISPLNLRRIKESIEGQLVAKGFVQAAPESADFVISATVGARDHIDRAVYPDPYRPVWRWDSRFYADGFGTAVGVEMYTEGTLALDVFDERSKQAIWHGWATKRITNADIADASEPIQRAVEAILSDFPPRAE